MRHPLRFSLLALLALSITGCSTVSRVRTKLAEAIAPALAGSPATVDTHVKQEALTIPKGSVLIERRTAAIPAQPATATTPAIPAAPATVETEVHVSENAVLTRNVEDVQASSGAIDVSVATTKAKLESYAYVQYAGIVCLLAAAAMFHPLVRAAVGGGKSTQMAVAGVGVVLIFGPSLVVGHETALLLGCAGFLFYHYTTSRLSYKEGHVDANNAAK